MEDETFTVACSDHHQALVNGLWDFYSSRRGTDFHVLVGGQSVQAHQLLLEVFLSPLKLGLCALKDWKRSINLEALLEFLYRGSVTLKRDEIDGLLEAANDTDFKMLVDAIESSGYSKTRARPSRREPKKKRNGDSDDVPLGDDFATARAQPADVESDNSAGDWSPAKKIASRPIGRRTRTPAKNELNFDQAASRKRSANRPNRTKVNVTSDSSSESESLESGSEEDSSGDPAPTKAGRSAAQKSRPSTWFRCKECSYISRKELRFQQHMASRHDPNGSLLPCQKCYKCFTTAALLANHMNVHAKTLATFSCPFCSYQSLKAGNYYHHLRSSHEMNPSGEPVPKRHKCSDCDFKSVCRFKLKSHRDAIHATVKCFKCNLCDYRASIESNLTKHIKVTHLKIRPYICEICASTFTKLDHLKKHHKMHTGEKPYVCSLESCRKAYASQYAFKAHVRRHQGINDKVFVCDVCGFACNRNDNLRAHLRNVHGRKQESLGIIIDSASLPAAV